MDAYDGDENTSNIAKDVDSGPQPEMQQQDVQLEGVLAQDDRFT